MGALEADEHALAPELVARALGDRGSFTVRSEECCGQVLIELRSVGENRRTDVAECFDRRALGIRFGLDHDRRDRSGGHDRWRPCRRLSGGVAHHLAATGGVADEDDVLQIQAVDQRGKSAA